MHFISDFFLHCHLSTFLPHGTRTETEPLHQLTYDSIIICTMCLLVWPGTVEEEE